METTFYKKITAEKAIFDELKKDSKGYNKPAMVEVLEYLKQYRAEKNRGEQTVYNAELEDFIIEKEKLNLSFEMKHYLGTEVYLSQKDYRAEIKKAYKEKMLKAGYIELTRDIDYRGKIELVASKEGMLGTANIEKMATIITGGDGYPFIIPQGKRTRGWYVTSLDNAFFKPLNL